jgi:hypothetical protein
VIYGPIDLSEGLMFLLDLKVTFPMNNRSLLFFSAPSLPSVMITREVRSCRRLHHDTIVAVLALI